MPAVSESRLGLLHLCKTAELTPFQVYMHTHISTPAPCSFLSREGPDKGNCHREENAGDTVQTLISEPRLGASPLETLTHQVWPRARWEMKPVHKPLSGEIFHIETRRFSVGEGGASTPRFVLYP